MMMRNEPMSKQQSTHEHEKRLPH